MKRIRTLIFLFFGILSQLLVGQNRGIDSLKKVLNDMPVESKGLGEDTIRISLLNRISRLFLFAGSYDSSLHYANRSWQLAASKEQVPAVKRGLGRAYNSIGLAHYYRGNYPEALKNHYSALKIQEEARDQSGIANSYNHLGLVYYSQGQSEEALRNHEASLKIKLKIHDKPGIVASYVNIGNIYHDQGEFTAALKNYYSGLSAAEKMGDKQVMGTCYNNIGTVYLRQNKYDYALSNYKKAFEVRQGIGDKYGDAMSYGNLSDVYYQLGNYKEAETYARKSLDIAGEIGSLELIKEANSALSNAYIKLGRYEKALDYYKAHVLAKDCLLNEQNTRKSLESQMRYAYDKKITADSIRVAGEQRILAAQLDYEKSRRIGLYVGLFLLILFAVFMVNRFRVTMRQKDIIKHQKDLVEGKQKEILDSINYALRIQKSLLASDSLLDSHFRPVSSDRGGEEDRDYFILFKPKDIVSGDFYWASKLHNGEFVLAIGDSTGHGVPGAIMSILNIACLNEAVLRNVMSPDRILFEARKRIIEHLRNDGSNEGGRDGMDCCLLSFNFETNMLSFAGANNPLWIVRNEEVIELRPDKMPVGKHERDDEHFTLHTIEMKKGDMVYAFTDGYADQFGGTSGKKYMSRKFRELLLSIAKKPTRIQKQILNDSFESWRQGLEQVDDVTVFGLCVR
jgi:tetratricopeptide (TPR) repeat protein